MFTLSTQRISLRALEPEDVDLLYKWENNPEVWLISNTVSPYSKFTLMELVKVSTQDIFTAKQLRLMLDENRTHQTIGVLDIFEFDACHGRAGLGILIEKTCRQQGFAEEAIRLVTQYLFKHLHLHQIFCHVLNHNQAAIALFQKVGFTVAGCKKEWIRTSDGYEDVIFMQLLNTISAHE